MRLSLRNQKENIFYLILWLVLFAAPVLTSYIRSTTGEEIPVHWPEIFHVWKIFAVFLIIFLIHNFVLAPLLVYKERKRLYLATTGCLVAVFVLFNCYSSHRKEGGRPGLGPRMEVNDKMPPPMAEEPNLQGDNERPPFQKPRGPKPDEMPPGLPLLLTQGGIVNSLFLILLLGMNIGVKLYFKSDRDRKQMLVLERENIESQLEYLKYQINPHFFMNTLNNIHALVDIDPEKAKTSIVDLSKLMRYVLYEGNHPMVPLGRDVDFLRNYLKLLNAFRHQTLHFSHDFFDGMGLLFPCDDRNGTISTMPIAAFAYLQIGIVRRCRKVPLIGGFLMIGSIQVCDDSSPIELAVELIYFGQFLLQLLEVALREATHHDEVL